MLSVGLEVGVEGQVDVVGVTVDQGHHLRMQTHQCYSCNEEYLDALFSLNWVGPIRIPHVSLQVCIVHDAKRR